MIAHSFRFLYKQLQHIACRSLEHAVVRSTNILNNVCTLHWYVTRKARLGRLPEYLSVEFKKREELFNKTRIIHPGIADIIGLIRHFSRRILRYAITLASGVILRSQQLRTNRYAINYLFTQPSTYIRGFFCGVHAVKSPCCNSNRTFK
ncbi:hypothetical protein GJV44_00407 [Candidatus Vallotia cooleyia]|nr:hypothetical protein GJV44_00407 [Candidatus Vallotia cooleyia]